MAISPHESIVALASVDGSLTTYFANTGMAIDDRKFPGFKIEYIGFHGQDDQLFVILRSSVNYELSAWILDSLQLKSETAANQVPIPTIDSTILALFYVKRFWKRGIICESDGTKINCYISHQPTSSKLIKDSETALKAAPEDVVYESSHDVDIQYRLLTGIHRELLPEGDGKSYWVLRVEVVEENLKQKTSRIIFSFVPEPWMRVTTEEVVHPENLQSTFFVPCGTRFAVVGMQTLQIWNLPTTENSKCSLQFIWSQPRDEKELLPGGVAYKSRRVRDYYMDIMGISIFLDAETGSTVAEIKMNDRSRKKIVPIPGPGNIGARYAILYCFRSVHLLSAAYTFSHNESKKTTRDSPQLTFTFEDHAEAIVRFTREHINRMMSICVFSPRRPGQAQNNTKDAKGTKRPGPSTVNQPAPLNNIQPISDADVLESSASAPGAVVVGENVTVHANANRHDDDEVDLRPQNIRGKHDYKRRTPQSKSSTRSDVVTVLTLLLDHPHLQRTNHVFVEGLLNSSNGDWIPRDNKALNPIKRVIEARNGQLLEAFVDYCIKNAKKYHPAYLMPAVQCLNELSDRYPNVLADLFRKASYVPVHNYGYVASHAIIANEQYGKWLKSKLMFWNIFTGKKFEKSNNINDYEKPVFSLRSQLPFRASSLLNILHIETSVREKREEEFPARPDVVEEDKKSLQSEFSHKIYVSPFPKLSMYGPYRPWFKDMASAKSAFTDIAGQDFFDSPAMVATLEFKWQKFGLFYWIWRFSVVFTFFVLVLIITAKQIYTSSNLDDVSPADIASRYLLEWRPLFKAVIIFGFILIVYEIMQFLDSPRKYIRSPYNYMDLAAYVLPVVGCLMFLQTQPGPIDISTDIVDGDRGPSQIWVMSFAILALYMNILFELRVIKQLGIVVNIILNITRRIGWFFLIFGLFLIAFTHALLHLLHTRRYDPCVANDTCEGEGRDYPDGYPTGFFSALSATYFFLAGRYDPISDSFDKGSTSFHVMMVIFFFFTAILLLNILIALMNDAYNESKDQGQLAWLKQWSEVIAEVEIFLMSQGARQNRNYFPDYVYYGANEQEAELYESKYYIANKSNLSIENRFLVDTVTGEQVVAQVTQRAIHKDVQLLKQELERMKNAQDGFNQDMTELMAAFLAQTTTVAPTSPDCDQPPQVSPVENDPPNSGASPTTGSGISVPGGPLSAPGTGLPGGVVRSSAGAAAAAAAVFSTAGQSNRRSKKQSSVPFRRKISTTILETESPTSYSPTVHFNSPQSSISTSPISAGDAASHLPGEGTIDAGPASVGASPSSVPQRIAEHPHLAGPVRRKSSYSSIKRRLQQKLAVVRTMDDVLKTHQMIEDNNASHPIYIKPPGRRDSEDDELYDTEEDEEDLMKTVTVHHAQRPSPDQPEHLRRAHSEILLRSIPHNPIPLHTLPVHPSPGEDSTVQN
ncbi:hypothetical protein BC939DRAFT_441306, partial [Gamsiella multidivaricata]|uniref:uncharacterized protein n=1 Tax=Gamsiella multidivaricata TaxID=101098 RepID=UPI00221E7A4E